MSVEQETCTLSVTLALPNATARTVRIGPGRPGHVAVDVVGPPPGAGQARAILDAVRHVLRLDEDLSAFYSMAESDPTMSWAARGAGRMVQSQTVFEDVVKTICTTNCAWSATERMVGALVEHLGTRAPRASSSGPWGRAFPTPAAMASAGEDFYRSVARAGYRGAYLRQLAATVASGELDLESLGRATPEEMSDDEVASELLALPGVGPYAAAHIRMTIGRYSRLILDSWTRPTYAKLAGRRTVKDSAIERRFRRYGPYAGLAFWLFVTRDWIDDGQVGDS